MANGDKATKNGNGGNLGFEAEMFKAADKLRGNMEPSDYKHVALGLIFLKYISDAFEAKHTALLAEDEAAAEDKDEYLADNVFWVPTTLKSPDEGQPDFGDVAHLSHPGASWRSGGCQTRKTSQRRTTPAFLRPTPAEGRPAIGHPGLRSAMSVLRS